MAGCEASISRPLSSPPEHRVEFRGMGLFDDTVALEESLGGHRAEDFSFHTEVLDGPVHMPNGEVDDGVGEEVVLDSDDDERTGTAGGNGGRGGESFCPSDQGSVGCLRRLFSSVRAPFLQTGSGLAAHNTGVIETDHKLQQQLEDDEVTRLKVQYSEVIEPDGLDDSAGLVVKEAEGKLSDCKWVVKSDNDVNTLVNQRVPGQLEGTQAGNDLSQLPTCDSKSRRLSNCESQEPGESSQADALRVVDQYLSLNNFDLSQEGEPRKVARQISSTVPRGAQSLAKQINLRTAVGKKGIFEWDGCQNDPSDMIINGKGTDPFFNCKGHGLGSNTCPNKDFGDQEGIFPGNARTEKKNLLSVHNETTVLTHLDPRNLVQQSDDASLGKHVAAQSSHQEFKATSIECDTIEMFDIGLGTQIAAEAMEALSNALPDHGNGNAAYQGPQKPFDDPSKVVTKKDCGLGRCESQKRNYPKSGITAKQCKRHHLPTDELNKETSALLVDHSKNQGFTTKTERKCKLQGRSTRNKCKRIQKINAEDISARDSKTEVDKFIKSSIAIEHTSFGTLQLRGRSEKTKQPLQQKMDSSSRKTSTHAKANLHKNMGKSNGLYADAFEVWSFRKKRSKTRFNRSHRVKNSEPDTGAPKNVKAASLELNIWSYPRRKRTCQTVPCHSLKKTKVNTIVSGDWQEHNDVKEKAHALKRKFEGSLVKQDLDAKVSETPGVKYDATGLNKRIFPLKRVEARGTTQFSNLDEMGSLSLNVAVNGSKNKSLKIRKVVEEFDSKSGCNNQHHSKNLSKPFLIKKGVSLESLKSVHDLHNNDSRRRRTMANVRVLFSQNLDDYTIKHQKKIMKRLGISIASSSFDATHFIADQFLRTRNMLEAIALGKPVVTHLWLESCGQTKCYIDEKNYLLRDAKKEKEIGFSMPATLSRAIHHPLLRGQRVLVTPNVKPGKAMISSLVKAAHGEAIESKDISKVKDTSDNLLILSCEEDYEFCAPFLAKGSAVYSSELLLSGIVIQKLEYKRHQLFSYHVKIKKPKA